MHECQEIRSANINQKEDRFLIYERDLFKRLNILNIYGHYLTLILLIKLCRITLKHHKFLIF